MQQNLQALNINRRESKDEVSNTKEKILNTLTEELYFAICSPIGSLKEPVITELKKQLIETYKYEVETIKLSDFIEQHKTTDFVAQPGETNIFSKYSFKINQGNLLRERYDNRILAELSIAKIYSDRAETVDDHLVDTNYKSRRKCYIFDSIKSKDELDLFRSVYTDNFFQISIFSPENERIENLIQKGFSEPESNKIIEIDEYQKLKFGQNVRGTFVDGDFFLRVSKNNNLSIDERIARYLHLIFESKIITPTIDETSMYFAKSAANNSSCLSRQVGACITDENGNILSTGWNDVPKYGGNLYRDQTPNDDRCFTKGFCTNDRQKDIITDDISEILKEETDLKPFFTNDKNEFDIVKFNSFKDKIRNSRIKDLIEFSRSVHAEMHAIVLGSQLSGVTMVKGKLFCTTYPCHNCARHIILAGIAEVYFIEPYIKSLCLKLHDDSITENENEDEKVKILIFDGVAPRKYQTFFTNFDDRKNKKGDLIVKDFEKIKPKVAKSLQALPSLERQAIFSLKEYGLITTD